MMEAEETKSLDEAMDEIVMWSITGVVVVVLVVVTVLVVRRILKSTPARENVDHVGRKSERDWKSRVVEYYRDHKFTGYWKVTDREAPKWDPNKPRTGTYSEGTIRTTREATEELANTDDEIYSSGTVNYVAGIN